MVGGYPEAVAVAVTVMVFGSADSPADAEDARVVRLFDGTTKLTVTLLDTDGEPAGQPVTLDGVDLSASGETTGEGSDDDLVPCAFGDTFSQVGILTADEAAFYHEFGSVHVDWAAHIGELVEFTAEFTGIAYLQVVRKRAG